MRLQDLIDNYLYGSDRPDTGGQPPVRTNLLTDLMINSLTQQKQDLEELLEGPDPDGIADIMARINTLTAEIADMEVMRTASIVLIKNDREGRGLAARLDPPCPIPGLWARSGLQHIVQDFHFDSGRQNSSNGRVDVVVRNAGGEQVLGPVTFTSVSPKFSLLTLYPANATVPSPTKMETWSLVLKADKDYPLRFIMKP